MSVTDTDKIDFLWKKVIFGTATTADASLKAGSNETIASPLSVYANQIWAQTDAAAIPATPPGATTETITRFFGAQRIRMMPDTTVPADVTWLAATTFNDLDTRIGDFVPPTFGAAYVVEVYIGDPHTGPAARIFPDATAEPWVFDYASGVLHFPSAVPATKTATIGSGSVTVADNGIFIQVYHYTGTKGVAAAGTTSRNHIVANIAARNALTGIAAGDTAYVVDASAMVTDAGAGEYAIYIWTGSAWSLLATQDSARTDAKTTVAMVTTPINNPYSLGFAGNNTRVVSVVVEVRTPFDRATNLGLGTSGNTQLLVGHDETDLSATGTFVIYPNYVFPVETLLGAYLTAVDPSSPPSVGQVVVTITYA